MARESSLVSNPTLDWVDDADFTSSASDTEVGQLPPWMCRLLAPCCCIACGAGVVALIIALSEPAKASGCRGFKQCPSYPLPYAWGTWPKSYSYEGRFPEHFAWGVGTAAYQVEGAYREGKRGASIWDTFCGADTVGMPGANCSYCCQTAPCPINKGVKSQGDTGNVATDSYHMYKTDLALMKAMGLKNYRFSISWPRLFPTGAGEVNEEAVQWYNHFIDELLNAGITPFVTLYHWDLPQALLSPPQRSAWWARDASGRPVQEIHKEWAHYVDSCFRLFGDRVKHWVTFNEAWTATKLASGSGKAPSIEPFMDPKKDPYIAGHNILLAHGSAVRIYREKYQARQGGWIGITNNNDWREPKSDTEDDIAAAERAVLFTLGWFSEPIFGTGDYPVEMRAVLGDILPNFTTEEKQMLKGSSDFFGLNHYGTSWIAGSSEPGWDFTYAVTSTEGLIHGQSAWLYGAAWGLRKLLNWIKRRYHDPLIYITESGWSMSADTADDAFNDTDRLYYYANYTSEVGRAIREDKVNVAGYFAWSLLDNYEWEMGYKERFGITFVDFNPGFDPNAPLPNTHVPTPGQQLRRRKRSSCYLEHLWRKNRMMEPSEDLCVDATVFQGDYRDALNCSHRIEVSASGISGSVTGQTPLGGPCNEKDNQPYGPAVLFFSGSTVVCKTCKIASQLQGFWSIDSGIQWDDGSLWVKVKGGFNSK